MRAKKKLPESELFDYALKALSARANSAGELREKLRQRAEKMGDVDGILARLKEYGYLNDKQYAENYAARRLENEGFGRSRVLSDLRSRRVAPAVAERAVNSTFQNVDEVELIEQFLARKYRKQPLGEILAEPKGLASAFRRLRAAGFSSGNALRVLKRYAKDHEALEALESSAEEEPAEPGE